MPFGCFGISPWPNEDVERNAFLVHRTPEIVLHAVDLDEHLIRVPLVNWPQTAVAQPAGKALAGFLAPAPDCLAGHGDVSLGQKELNVA